MKIDETAKRRIMPEVACQVDRPEEGNMMGFLVLFGITMLLASCAGAAGICSEEAGSILAIRGSEVSWNLTNNENASMAICNISLTWPQSNGNLSMIEIKGKRILQKEIGWSAGPVAITVWNCSDSCRIVGPGETATLAASFENNASMTMPGQYGLSATLCSNCSPECRFIAGNSLEFGQKFVIWNITNLGAQPAEICSIELSWPGINGDLKQVDLEGTGLFRKALPWSGNSTEISGWDCDLSGCTIRQGETKALNLSFEKNVSENDLDQYGILVRFCNGCALQFRQADRICNISTGNIELDDGNKSAGLTIANWGNSQVTLCKIKLSIPQDHGHLRSVELDGREIFEGDKAPQNVTIPGNGSGWNGTEEMLSIGQGHVRTLRLNFEKERNGSYYPIHIQSLQAVLCECSQPLPLNRACGKPGFGCDYTVPPSIGEDNSACRVIGPRSMCNNSVGVYIPVVSGVLASEGYTYTWTIDGGKSFEGSPLSLDGRSLSLGKHVLVLNVREGGDKVCSTQKEIEVFPAPSFTMIVD